MHKGRWKDVVELIASTAIVREEPHPERLTVWSLPLKARARDEFRRFLAELQAP